MVMGAKGGCLLPPFLAALVDRLFDFIVISAYFPRMIDLPPTKPVVWIGSSRKDFSDHDQNHPRDRQR